MPDFNSSASVDDWLQANGGVEGLRKAIETGRFSNRNKIEAEAWLHAYDRGQFARTEDVDRVLAERSVIAVETTADAAAASARWAMLAAFIAVVAVLVNVAQYLTCR